MTVPPVPGGESVGGPVLVGISGVSGDPGVGGLSISSGGTMCTMSRTFFVPTFSGINQPIELSTSGPPRIPSSRCANTSAPPSISATFSLESTSLPMLASSSAASNSFRYLCPAKRLTCDSSNRYAPPGGNLYLLLVRNMSPLTASIHCSLVHVEGGSLNSTKPCSVSAMNVPFFS